MRLFHRLFLTTLALLACGMEPLRGADLPDLRIEPEDLLVALNLSYAKIRIEGPEGAEFELLVQDAKDADATKVIDLKIGPAGFGELFLSATAADGLTSPQKRAHIRYRYSTAPFFTHGTFEFDKFWPCKKCTTTTTGYVAESFNSPRIHWNVGSGSRCVITRIYWSTIPYLDPIDTPEKSKEVGVVVLRAKKVVTPTK